MASDDVDRFDRDLFEADFVKLERALKLTSLQDKYVPKEPVDDEDLLASMLTSRVIAKLLTPEDSKIPDEIEELIKTLVSEMPEDEARRAAVVAKRRAQEWLKELQGLVPDDGYEE